MLLVAYSPHTLPPCHPRSLKCLKDQNGSKESKQIKSFKNFKMVYVVGQTTYVHLYSKLTL